MSTSNPLPDALLLAFTGGLLDAVVYLNHGHVFANAMSGNMIFLAIAFVSQRWSEIIPHLVPLAGYVAGIFTSKHLRTRVDSHVAQIGLVLELTVIFVLGWLSPSLPKMLFTAVVAYVAAVQVASFRRVDRFSYNSTFMTGNLRDVVEGFYEGFTRRGSTSDEVDARDRGRVQTRDLGLICLCFLAGAVVGAWAAPRFGNRSFWLAEPCLVAVLLRHPRDVFAQK